MSARLGRGEVAGWQSRTLENGRLRVVVLPAKGAELHRLVDVASGVDVLFRAPWGLQPPGAPPRQGSGADEFLWNYAGGWQELFPSANDACTYRGRRVPFHGEVATMAWEEAVLAAGPSEVAVAFSVRSQLTPLRLERVLRLRVDEPRLLIEETVVNEGDEPAHLVWGHHCVVGPPFLEAGCELRLPARTITTIAEPWEDTARLAPGQRETWPLARTRNGGLVDLREVPGPEAGSHDDVYLTDLDAGWAAVHNPRLDLTFSLTFDPGLFRWIICWQPYGGARAMPLRGSYALGIEPWSSSVGLERAVADSSAIELPPGGTLTTTLAAAVEPGRFLSEADA